MAKIYNHTLPQYMRRLEICGRNKWNGAYYYSREICENIIPLVDTDRSWITVNVPRYGCNHAIVFVHNNLHRELYDWLKMYEDIVFVCGVKETAEAFKELGETIYLPLSIDLDYVEQFKQEKTKKVAFAGRPAKRNLGKLPSDIDYIEGLPRAMFLEEMARYEKIYAVGRTALEAKALGCEVLPYDDRFPDPSIWEVLDNKEAAKILQEELDKIDGKTVKRENADEPEAKPKEEVKAKEETKKAKPKKKEKKNVRKK